MDSIFNLAEPDRAAFLPHMLRSFGSTYICLWSYYLHPPSNCLLFLDGVYQEAESSQQASSSSGRLARRLFDAYCGSVNYIDHGRVPGFAFKNNLPYMEMKLHELQSVASSQVQMQFYQEAGIKTVVFMGCGTGEIELGISSELQVDLEMKLKQWFPVDFSRLSQTAAPVELPHQPTNQNTSSSRSLSVESIEYSSSSLFNVPSSSFNTTEAQAVMSCTSSPHEQAVQALSQIRSVQFPTIASEDAAMTRAILAVLSSPSSTSSTPQQNLPPISPPTAAFSHYRPSLVPVAARNRKNNSMFRRAVLFFRGLNMRRRHELQIQGNRPTTTQLHHMISERKRREKLNESFQVLRSLLPPGSKKDKASVLSSTTEYLSSLKSQVAELNERNQILQNQLSTTGKVSCEDQVGSVGVLSSSPSTADHRRVNVEIEHVPTSEARFLDLRVTLRLGECSMLDLVIRILELLKHQRDVSLLSIQSSSRRVDSVQVHSLILRFKVEGDEFDGCGFEEAVKRAVDDPPVPH